VVFTIDGKAQAPTSLVLVNGKEQATFPAENLRAGTHQIGSAFVGTVQFTKSSSNTVSLRVTAPVTGGPQITRVQRLGFHAQPTTLLLTFNQALDPVQAQDASNYQILAPDGEAIAVTRAVYDATTQMVTLYPSTRLDLHQMYVLTVNGHAPNGLTNTQGTLLDGAGNSDAGSNYAGILTAAQLALNAQLVPDPERLEKLRETVAEIIKQQDKQLGITPARHYALHPTAVDAVLAAGPPSERGRESFVDPFVYPRSRSNRLPTPLFTLRCTST